MGGLGSSLREIIFWKGKFPDRRQSACSSPCPAVTVYGSGVLRCACEGEGMGGEAK